MYDDAELTDDDKWYADELTKSRTCDYSCYADDQIPDVRSLMTSTPGARGGRGG